MYLIKAEIAVIAFLVLIAALAVKVSYGWMFGLPLLLVFVLLVVIFRHPKRKIPTRANTILSPIDAVVETVFGADEPFLNSMCLVVRLRRRHFGVLGLYSPVQGQVQKSWYGEKYGRVVNEEARDIGHIYTTWIRTDDQEDVLMSFYRARTLRYLQMRPQTGERVGQGRVLGLSSIRYVDILVPKDVAIKVKAGDTVKAGESVLGMFCSPSKKKNA